MTGDLSETVNELLLTEVRKMVTLEKDRCDYRKQLDAQFNYIVLIGIALIAGVALGAYIGYQQGAADMLALVKSGMLTSGVVP